MSKDYNSKGVGYLGILPLIVLCDEWGEVTHLIHLRM